jgi:hypothetical protein
VGLGRGETSPELKSVAGPPPEREELAPWSPHLLPRGRGTHLLTAPWPPRLQEEAETHGKH